MKDVILGSKVKGIDELSGKNWDVQG